MIFLTGIAGMPHGYLAFFQEFFSGGGGGKIYCHAISIVIANFSIVFGPNWKGRKISEGKLLDCPPPPLQKKARLLMIILTGTEDSLYKVSFTPVHSSFALELNRETGSGNNSAYSYVLSLHDCCPDLPVVYFCRTYRMVTWHE